MIKISSRWNVLRGLRFDIKWIDYKLHFHQNSLRDQMLNCELYTIIPGYAHKPFWSIREKFIPIRWKQRSVFNIEGLEIMIFILMVKNFLPLDNKQIFQSNKRYWLDIWPFMSHTNWFKRHVSVLSLLIYEVSLVQTRMRIALIL